MSPYKLRVLHGLWNCCRNYCTSKSSVICFACYIVIVLLAHVCAIKSRDFEKRKKNFWAYRNKFIWCYCVETTRASSAGFLNTKMSLIEEDSFLFSWQINLPLASFLWFAIQMFFFLSWRLSSAWKKNLRPRLHETRRKQDFFLSTKKENSNLSPRQPKKREMGQSQKRKFSKF